MIYIGVQGADLELLMQLASERHAQAERLARKAFRWGLKALSVSNKDGRCAQQEKLARLDERILREWESSNDADIGRDVQSTSRDGVRHRRYALGLKRKIAGRRRSIVRERTVPSEFERMVLREGYTMTEYIRHKGLRCSRERVRQAAEELGLKHSPEDRSPEWYLFRKARGLGKIFLADREWFAAHIAQFESIAASAAAVNVSGADMLYFVQQFGLSHPALRKSDVTVTLRCVVCKTNFVRLRGYVETRREKVGHGATFVCSQACAGSRRAELVQKRLEPVLSCITEQWAVRSDEQMATDLGIRTSKVKKWRIRLGLLRK